METYMIVKSGLVLHLAGIIMMIGITIASLAIFQQSSNLFHNETGKALLVLKYTSAAYPKLQIIGAILLLTGGVTMMIAYHGVFMHAQWFRIKMVLLALIILTQLFIGRPALFLMIIILSAFRFS